MNLLVEALLSSVRGATVDVVNVLGRRHRVDFHAPYPMVTTDLTASQIFEGAIARHARGVLDGVTVYPVSAAVYRVEAMEVPAKVYILTATFGGMFSGSETVGVYATRELAEEAAAGNFMPHIEEAAVQTRVAGAASGGDE